MVQLNREAILEIIETQELKRWWVAEFSGVHKTTLRRWLSGRIRNVTLGNVHRLASTLEVSPSDIILGT